MIESLNHLDQQLLLYLNSLHNSVWDSLMWQISGKYLWIPLYLGILAFIIIKYKKQSWTIILAITLVILISDQVASSIIKPLVERFRPTHNPSLAGLIHIVNDYTGGKYGFVSSHAANTFGLSLFLSLLFKNRVFTILIFIWAAIVSYSRIYLGVHYPGDIICGALVGVGAGALMYYVWVKFALQKFYPNTEAI